MTPERVRLAVELDTTMSFSAEDWRKHLADWLRDGVAYGSHPTVTIIDIIPTCPEIGDVLDTAEKVEALPRGSAVEGAGVLFVLFDNDEAPWKQSRNGTWHATHDIGLPAVVRFVP